MKYRQMPRTDLQLSEVGFGLWTVATNWWGNIPEEQRAALLENAVDLGINFFDTADTYGEGYGEEILAKVLGHKRHEIVIATKFGYDFYDKLTPRTILHGGSCSNCIIPITLLLAARGSPGCHRLAKHHSTPWSIIASSCDDIQPN